jgi:hypothetical protein
MVKRQVLSSDEIRKELKKTFGWKLSKTNALRDKKYYCPLDLAELESDVREIKEIVKQYFGLSSDDFIINLYNPGGIFDCDDFANMFSSEIAKLHNNRYMHGVHMHPYAYCVLNIVEKINGYFGGTTLHETSIVYTIKDGWFIVDLTNNNRNIVSVNKSSLVSDVHGINKMMIAARWPKIINIG